MTARVGGRAGTRVSWAVVVPALRSNRNPWRPGQPAKNSLQVQLVFPLRAGRQDSRRTMSGVSPCGTGRGREAMLGCRSCVRQTNQGAILRARQTMVKWRSHSAAQFVPKHRYFPGCLCLHCRFRTMGALYVTFQSLQKPVVKKPSKGCYKK